MADKVRFGIIGTGAIAAMHAEALKDAKNAELVAVFDQVTERARQFAEKHNVRAVDNFEEFLADPEIDALVAARTEAKKAKNWAEADRIRDELKARGIEIIDTPQGAKWRKV